MAAALQSQQEELLAAISRRGDARGLTASALEETVNDAICIVVMMGRPILSEQHLMGAFWATARILLRHHHEGRHSLRVGSRARVGLQTLEDQIEVDDLSPDDVLALKDRLARAADFAAQLDDLEREVVAVMAIRGAGVKMAARLLGLPVAQVKAAHRSAQLKLDRVAAIAAAGRMCDYRERVILAYSQESANEQEAHRAQVHLAACAPCRTAYVQLVREMRGSTFQRGTAAALLPVPMFALDHQLG
ncbi:MAG TPA: ECF-type sigma factor, partial [Solirubrobacteraceae bacterium]|nr:ECF-type sigma factor [Solirubrobacteraceae bacterium]